MCVRYCHEGFKKQQYFILNWSHCLEEMPWFLLPLLIFPTYSSVTMEPLVLEPGLYYLRQFPLYLDSWSLTSIWGLHSYREIATNECARIYVSDGLKNLQVWELSIPTSVLIYRKSCLLPQTVCEPNSPDNFHNS